jgi:hypothetical protein
VTRAQVAALGYPEGEILDKAVAVVKAVKKAAKGAGVETSKDKLTALLEHVKARPSGYTHKGNRTEVQELAWAWLGTRQEVAT